MSTEQPDDPRLRELRDENARLRDEGARRERWSAALAAVTDALLSEHTVDILAVLAERVASVIDSELVCVIVADGTADGEPMLRVDTARGVGGAELIGRRPCAEPRLVHQGRHGPPERVRSDVGVLEPGEDVLQVGLGVVRVAQVPQRRREDRIPLVGLPGPPCAVSAWLRPNWAVRPPASPLATWASA